MFVSGEIHLTPLKGVIQLRPHFEYLDRSKERKPPTADEGLYTLVLACVVVKLYPRTSYSHAQAQIRGGLTPHKILNIA